MKMPGFTADASLSKTKAGYQRACISRTPRSSGEFLPQLSYWYYCDDSGCYTCSHWGCRPIGPIKQA
jgi:hypothetical protein